jgi:hypothetical protein
MPQLARILRQSVWLWTVSGYPGTIRAVDRKDDLFEKVEDGSLIWRGAASGLEAAVVELKKLASETPNEVKVMYLATQAVVATMNSHETD